MDINTAITLVEIGTGVLAETAPGAAPAAEIIEKFAELLGKQISVYQQMSGQSIDAVIAKLTPEPDLNPSV